MLYWKKWGLYHQLLYKFDKSWLKSFRLVYNKLYQSVKAIQYSQGNNTFFSHNNNNLSNLSINKYKKMKEKDIYRSIGKDNEDYGNNFKLTLIFLYTFIVLTGVLKFIIFLLFTS